MGFDYNLEERVDFGRNVDGSRNVTEELLNGIAEDPMPAAIKKASGSRSLALEQTRARWRASRPFGFNI